MDETIQVSRQRRRSSILPQIPLPAPNNDDAASSNDPKVSEVKSFELKLPSSFQEEKVDVNQLRSCLNDLTSERSARKNLWAERKLLRNSDERKKASPKLSWDSAQEFLSEEDIAFLKDAPPYEEINKEYDRLVLETAMLQNKFEKVSTTSSYIQDLAQSHLNCIKKNIGEFSERNLDLPKLS